MIKRIYIAVISIVLSFGLAGCALAGMLQEPTNRTDATLSTGTPQTDQSTTAASSTTDPSVLQLPTTEPSQSETTLPVIVQPEPRDEDFVKVVMYIPDVIVDLRYSTENNFIKQKIYDFTDVWLRYGTVKKLMLVQEELKQHGCVLKIWDGFRPTSAQFKLWDVYPDPNFVANPNNGYSSHSRGNTVDVTLVHPDGREMIMPTGFDDFSKLADRDYSDCSKEAAENALLLEQLMIKHGFVPYSGEWWHFTDTQSYPVEQAFEPTATAAYYADCDVNISLRTNPSTTVEVITKILAGEQFEVVAKSGEFALVEYQGLYGYVLRNDIKPVFPAPADI